MYHSFTIHFFDPVPPRKCSDPIRIEKTGGAVETFSDPDGGVSKAYVVKPGCASKACLGVTRSFGDLYYKPIGVTYWVDIYHCLKTKHFLLNQAGEVLLLAPNSDKNYYGRVQS